ncbi:hypothetical protein HORM4_910013 [Vibrio harveyi]|nr:hypothetical protein HORM4_910013 [Vibrio harveyi]
MSNPKTRKFHAITTKTKVMIFVYAPMKKVHLETSTLCIRRLLIIIIILLYRSEFKVMVY